MYRRLVPFLSLVVLAALLYAAGVTTNGTVDEPAFLRAPGRELRTPNGNDYGKDLLRLHYLRHPHSTNN